MANVANREHVDMLLRDGVAVWNRWRVDNPNVQPDLSGADLSGVHLSGANLIGTDLSGANLSNANLYHARLYLANLRRADLSRVSLKAADLTDAYLVKANLTLCQTGGGGDGVNIAAGRLDLEDCDISSQSRHGVGIHNGAEPRVRRCRIHDNKKSGIYVFDQGQGLFEDCDIAANTYAGVAVRTSGTPSIKSDICLC